MMESNNAVEISGLTKIYGSNKALDDISFNVKRGEIMGFLGPNGAGKSTTMNILTGCISATSGSVSVCGCDVLENPMIVKSKIGYLPEQPPLYFDMMVWEYLNFVYDLKKVKKNKTEHISDIMELVKISDMKNRIIKNLSKGYRQRVGMAQALLGDPEVLILDEPTVGLDPKQIVEIRNVIKEIGKERTIILSTHILQEVSAVCDRVTIIAHGKIVAENTIEGLEELAGGKDKYKISILADKEQAQSVLSEVNGIVSIEPETQHDPDISEFIVTQEEGCDIRRDMFDAFSGANMPIMELKSAAMTLEEIFINLTSQPRFTSEDDSGISETDETVSGEEVIEEVINEIEDNSDNVKEQEADEDDGNI